ncbi:serine hydrolase domain-containing protein [Nonomuraea sp. NPDC055795]
MNVQGTVEAGFEGVREEFARVASADGAQLAVYAHGRRVVDLWTEVRGDSLHALYSSAKGAAHLVTALLVQEGVLELDQRVAHYWPEFAAEGKAGVTLRQVLAHQAGLVGVEGGFTTTELADDRLIAKRLAGQRPLWEPGTAYGYHAFVIGALTGEVVRRVTGASIQELYERRVRAPYELDFYLGLPEAQEPRYDPVRPAGRQPEPDPRGLMAVAFNVPTDLVAFANTRETRALGSSSAGSVGNARGLAGMYAAAIGVLDGRPALLAPETVAEFSRVHAEGGDLVTGESRPFGLGFVPMAARYPFADRRAFGHSGAVGALSFADPGRGLAYAYTRRRFSPAGGAWGAPENDTLVTALYNATT